MLTDGQDAFPRVLRFSPTFDERSARYKWNIFKKAVTPPPSPPPRKNKTKKKKKKQKKKKKTKKKNNKKTNKQKTSACVDGISRKLRDFHDLQNDDTLGVFGHAKQKYLEKKLLGFVRNGFTGKLDAVRTQSTLNILQADKWILFASYIICSLDIYI